MIHIAITAGGTEETIDGVRKITNMSSGSLSWFCLQAVLSYIDRHKIEAYTIHYIKAPRAVTNELNAEHASHINFIEVTNTQSVYDAVETLMNEVDVDIFIHAMAISDFSYAYSVAKSDLAEEIYQQSRHKKNLILP